VCVCVVGARGKGGGGMRAWEGGGLAQAKLTPHRHCPRRQAAMPVSTALQPFPLETLCRRSGVVSAPGQKSSLASKLTGMESWNALPEALVRSHSQLRGLQEAAAAAATVWCHLAMIRKECALGPS
jgi:hypothetical protein